MQASLAQSGQPGGVAFHQMAQAVDTPGVGLQTAAAFSGLVALGYMPGQAPLHVLEAVLEHSPPFGQSPHPDLGSPPTYFRSGPVAPGSADGSLRPSATGRRHRWPSPRARAAGPRALPDAPCRARSGRPAPCRGGRLRSPRCAPRRAPPPPGSGLRPGSDRGRRPGRPPDRWRWRWPGRRRRRPGRWRQRRRPAPMRRWRPRPLGEPVRWLWRRPGPTRRGRPNRRSRSGLRPR